MKKIITAASLVMGVSCAFLLAQADDSQTMSPPNDPSSMTGQQAGSPGSKDAAAPSDSMSSEAKSMSPDMKMMKKDHWASATECTDSAGMTYKKGSKSFRRCIETKRSQERAQMSQGKKGSEAGGTSGETPAKPDTSSGSNY